MTNALAIKTKDLRDNKKRDRRPCFVCEKHEYITEWHHVTNLKEVAQDIEYFYGSSIELVCLCPNCHTVVHAIEKIERIKDENKKHTAMASILETYTEEEGYKLINLYVKGIPK